MALKEFGDTAKGLARNPLGIIALFIVLIYGFAALVLGFSGNLNSGERIPLTWFLVLFPLVVLAVFSWLVSRHHTKLYAPSDYREDEAFLQAPLRQMEAAAALGAAAGRRLEAGAPTDEVASEAKAAAGVVARLARPQSVRSIQRRTILWVDDHPGNNRFEREAFEALGLSVVLSTSTEDALLRVSDQGFDVVISDMSRPPDHRAGYTLLQKLREQGNTAPFIIYAGSAAPEHRKEAERLGAQGTTNRPDELLQMVLRAMGVQTTF